MEPVYYSGHSWKTSCILINLPSIDYGLRGLHRSEDDAMMLKYHSKDVKKSKLKEKALKDEKIRSTIRASFEEGMSFNNVLEEDPEVT